MKVVRLSALRTGRLCPPGNIPGAHFCYRLSQPQDHSAAGMVMSMKNENDIIRNRIRELPACGVVPQPTAPPRNSTLMGLITRDIEFLILTAYWFSTYCLPCSRQTVSLSTAEQTVPVLINQISEITSTDHLTVNTFI